jgi:hypothetical protein
MSQNQNQVNHHLNGFNSPVQVVQTDQHQKVLKTSDQLQKRLVKVQDFLDERFYIQIYIKLIIFYRVILIIIYMN